VARLGVERAQLAVAEAVGEEVQVVEAHDGAELDRRIDRPAHRHADHRVRAEVGERGDVRAVRHVIRQPSVTLAVARHVQHVDAGEPAARDQRVAPLRLHRLRAGALEAGQRVRARARDDRDRHSAAA